MCLRVFGAAPGRTTKPCKTCKLTALFALRACITFPDRSASSCWVSPGVAKRCSQAVWGLARVNSESFMLSVGVPGFLKSHSTTNAGNARGNQEGCALCVINYGDAKGFVCSCSSFFCLFSSSVSRFCDNLVRRPGGPYPPSPAPIQVAHYAIPTVPLLSACAPYSLRVKVPQ